MNKGSLIPIVGLVCALIALPIVYQFGKRAATDELESKHENTVASIRLEHDRAMAGIDEKLAQIQIDFRDEQAGFESHVRETLLNTGVKLDVLNKEPEPIADVVIETVNLAISQEAFLGLRIGTTYNDVVEAIGREGENTLNLSDENGGGTSAYVWKWMNDDDREDRMTLTFVDMKLTSRDFSALKF
jgi:hypothetical protein